MALLSSLLPSDLVQEAGGFFEDASEYDKSLTFQDMNLSRPLLKVVALAMGVGSFLIDLILSVCMMCSCEIYACVCAGACGSKEVHWNPGSWSYE